MSGIREIAKSLLAQADENSIKTEELRPIIGSGNKRGWMFEEPANYRQVTITFTITDRRAMTDSESTTAGCVRQTEDER